MKIGISGKGGSGKTTLAATMARSLARSGRRVIAVDADSDPNLASSLGVAEADEELLRPFLDQSGARRVLPEPGIRPRELLHTHGYAGPDGVTLLLAARAEKAGSG